MRLVAKVGMQRRHAFIHLRPMRHVTRYALPPKLPRGTGPRSGRAERRRSAATGSTNYDGARFDNTEQTICEHDDFGGFFRIVQYNIAMRMRVLIRTNGAAKLKRCARASRSAWSAFISANGPLLGSKALRVSVVPTSLGGSFRGIPHGDLNRLHRFEHGRIYLPRDNVPKRLL